MSVDMSQWNTKKGIWEKELSFSLLLDEKRSMLLWLVLAAIFQQSQRP